MATTGKEAIDAFIMARKGNEPYDLICLDVMMPEMDGPEALRRIRVLEKEFAVKKGEEVKVLMTSVVENPRRVVDTYQAGATAYMIKPIDKTKLLAFLTEFKLI